MDYIRLVRDALRGVLRETLREVARSGFEGDQHLYITFQTGTEGVALPPALQVQYPEEMTIAIQHQFWDLSVNETSFAVTLAFDGIKQQLVIPFEHVRSFVDPSVPFGLQFDGPELDGPELDGPELDGPELNGESGDAHADPRIETPDEVSLTDEQAPTDAGATVVDLAGFRNRPRR